MPDVSTEVQSIRADIAQIVGLDPEKAAAIAAKRAQEAEIFRLSRQNGEKTYDDLVKGNEVDSVALGVGKFDISPITKVDELVPNVKKRVQEINPPPPEEHVNLFLDSFAQKALGDKNFEAAIACYNYITDEQLTTEVNRPYLEKLAQAAVTLEEKYDLYLALQQVIPQAEPSQATQESALEAEPMTEDQLKKAEADGPAPIAHPIPASTEADDADWRKAAGIVETPQADTNTSTAAQILAEQPATPLSVNAAQEVEQQVPINIATRKPTTETPMPLANVVPLERPTETPLPQPKPIAFPSAQAGNVPSTEPPVTSNGQILRPVPTQTEAAAQGLIDNFAGAITPAQSLSELPKAA